MEIRLDEILAIKQNDGLVHVECWRANDTEEEKKMSLQDLLKKEGVEPDDIFTEDDKDDDIVYFCARCNKVI